LGFTPVTWERVRFPTRNLEAKLCTLIPPSPNPTFGSRTWRIVDDTIFIWPSTANPNGAAWFPPHNSAITVYDNCERCHSKPPPPPSLSMLNMCGIVLTFFVNEDRAALTNFCRFAAPEEPDCFLCCVYGGDGNMRRPSQNCPLLLDGHRCFKCLGPHPKSDCRNSIPQSPDVCPKCHLSHNGQALSNVPLHEGRYGVDCPSQIQGERYWILLWAIWCRNPSDVRKAMPELMNITRNKELAQWMGLKAFGRSVTNFAWLANACIRMLERDHRCRRRF
jgi:hypothetical protein